MRNCEGEHDLARYASSTKAPTSCDVVIRLFTLLLYGRSSNDFVFLLSMDLYLHFRIFTRYRVLAPAAVVFMYVFCDWVSESTMGLCVRRSKPIFWSTGLRFRKVSECTMAQYVCRYDSLAVLAARVPRKAFFAHGYCPYSNGAQAADATMCAARFMRIQSVNELMSLPSRMIHCT